LDKEIRVSGKFDDLLDRIKKAYDRGTVTKYDLFNLLSRCEKNGRQHVFYYVPKNDEVADACSDVAKVERALLGGKMAQEADLPKTFLIPQGEVIADFRHETRPTTKYSWWTFKVYSGIERTRFLREEPINDTQFAKIYERYYAREIILVIWHSFGLLEIRRSIYTEMSLKTCREELERAWALVAGALQRDDFEPLDLKAALRELVKEAIDGSNSHDLHNAEFQDDKGGRVVFNPKKHDDSLAESKARRKAIEALRDCVTAAMTWKRPDGRPDLPEKLRTEICCFLPHEIRIGSKTTPEAIEHVSRRLFQLS
jgi:hypothetical protein